MKSLGEVESKLERVAGSRELPVGVRDALLALLGFLNDFLHRWFLTPVGERKPFWKALLVAFYTDFWKDLFGVKKHLDNLLDEL